MVYRGFFGEIHIYELENKLLPDLIGCSLRIDPLHPSY